MLPERKKNYHAAKRAGQESNNEDPEVALGINKELNRTSNDPRRQSEFVRYVKQACLDFHRSPIAYNQSFFKQKDILHLSSKILLHVQTVLDKLGAYDVFYKEYAGKNLYSLPMMNFVTNKTSGKEYESVSILGTSESVMEQHENFQVKTATTIPKNKAMDDFLNSTGR